MLNFLLGVVITIVGSLLIVMAALYIVFYCSGK